MKNRMVFYLFAVFAVMQMMVPLTGVLLQEHILRNGERFTFRTEPVDPYDPFHGKYVTVRINNRLELKEGESFERRQTVYAIIEKGEDGLAFFSRLEKEEPKGVAYLKSHVISAYSHNVVFDVPFRRYYLDESKAPRAEKYYREQNRGGKENATISVKIKNGRGALEELYIGGIPVLEFIKQAEEQDQDHQPQN